MGESQSGGGVDTDAGVSGTTGTQDSSYSPPSYSSLGQSPGAMGGRPDPTPSPVVSTPTVAFNNQPMSGDFFVNRVSRGLQNFLGGGTQTDDRGPSGADVGAGSVNDNPFNQGLASLSGVPDFVTMGGGTSSSPSDDRDTTMAALRRGAPALMASNQRDADQEMLMETRPNLFPQELGGGTIASPPRSSFQNIIDPIRTVPVGGGDPLLFRDDSPQIGPIQGPSIAPMQGPLPTDIDPTSDAAMFADLMSRPSGALSAASPVGNPMSFAETAKNPMSFPTDEATTLANLVTTGKKGNQKQEAQKLGFIDYVKKLGKDISGLSFSDIVGAVGDFLRGDPNYKGPSAAQQQLMGVPGPGPFVGGGVPSPSGGGGGGMAAPAKDPCPPGFRFDPTLQQCVPIIAPNTPTSPTTPTATPTTPATGVTPPAAGGIANAYPFTLTPPIGAPVGNLPPVRLTT